MLKSEFNQTATRIIIIDKKGSTNLKNKEKDGYIRYVDYIPNKRFIQTFSQISKKKT